MIKVGIFIDTYYPMVDGVISVVDNCAKRLQGEDFEVTVFCPIHDKKYVDDFNYKVERCKSFKVFFLDYRAPIPRLDRAFLKALRESNLDIVHIHSAFALGSMATRYAKKHNIPAIATLHSQYKKDFYKTTHSKVITSILLKNAIKVFNRCDECFTVNNAVADIFDEYGIKEHPAVIKNSTNFTPVEDRETAVKKVNEIFNLPKDVPVFTFLGRIYALKNVYFLVDAMSKLKDKNYRLLMVGDGKDLPALKKYTKKLGLSENIIFTGKITDQETLKGLFCRSKLFLFPSTYDANSIVQIEAASQGLPTVFVEGAATANDIIDGVNGFISKETPEDYARKIEQIMGDEKLYQTACEGVKRDIYRTWDETVDELKSVYTRLVSKNRKDKNIDDK